MTVAQRGQLGKWEAFWEEPVIVPEATHVLAVDLVLEQLRRYERPGQRLRVLDLGCGAGRVVRLIRQAGYQVVGLDLAEGALRSARRELGSAAHLIQGDAFQLGLATGSFDVVVSLGYASVGSYHNAQAELARVLRPGGLALIDFRRVSLYYLPVLATRGRHYLRAWRRGEVALPGVGLRLDPSWAAADLRPLASRAFNTFPPCGERIPRGAALTFERYLGRPLAPLLARTTLVLFRHLPPAGP